MGSFRCRLGVLLIDLDDWFTKKNIHFDWFVKDKGNHVSFLSRWGFDLWFRCK